MIIHGNAGRCIPPDNVPVHLKDIHLEMGMHCVDCHFDQDSHGDGNLYGETRAAVAVDCIDCHGTAEQPAAMIRYKQMSGKEKKSDEGKQLFKTLFTGNAAPSLTEGKKNDLIDDQYFEVEDGKLYQKVACAQSERSEYDHPLGSEADQHRRSGSRQVG